MFERPYELSEEGLSRLIDDLKHYADVVLPEKCYELVRRLAQVGLNEANVRIAESQWGTAITVSTDISRDTVNTSAMIMMVGPVTNGIDGSYPPFYSVLAIEFGAGIHYNETAINPFAEQFGLGIGSYPGQTHAFDPKGWYYRDEDGKFHHSYGVRATMPMYRAELAMQQQIADIAKSVFSEGGS